MKRLLLALSVVFALCAYAYSPDTADAGPLKWVGRKVSAPIRFIVKHRKRARSRRACR